MDELFLMGELVFVLKVFGVVVIVGSVNFGGEGSMGVLIVKVIKFGDDIVLVVIMWLVVEV